MEGLRNNWSKIEGLRNDWRLNRRNEERFR